MIACYLGLYEEGEVKHINGVWSTFLELQLVCCQNIRIHSTCTSAYVQRILIKIAMFWHLWPFDSKPSVNMFWGNWVDGTIDMLDFTFFIIIIPNSMQSLCDLSHLEIIFQKAQSRISMVLFVAQTMVKSSSVLHERMHKIHHNIV